jgi:glycosyltransferase involved in cell wall biosynthesis
MSPLKVLIVNYYPEVGGIQTCALSLALGLRSRGAVPEMMLYGAGHFLDRVREAGLPVHMVPPEVCRVRRLWHLGRFFQRGGYDLIHVMHEPVNLGLAARFLARKPAVLTVHMVRGTSRPKGLRRLLLSDRLLFRFFHRIICVSRELADECRGQGVPDRKLEVIYNAVSLDRFRPPRAEDRAAVRAELGIAPDALVVGAVGRLNGVKCYDDLLRAVARLRDVPRLICLLVGDGEERESLLRLRAELGLDGRALLAGQHSDVERMLWAMDVFAMPSWSEGQPLALLEAMATGLPVVATDVGAIPDTLDGTEAGILVHRRDVPALAQALCRFIGDPVARAGASRAARRLTHRFSVDQMVRRTLTVYGEALGREILNNADAR